MSKQMENVFAVVDEMKDEVIRRYDSGEEVKMSDIDEITTRAFKKIAEKRGVTESTVRDACTRRINMDTAAFYDSIRGLIEKPCRTTLIDKMESYGSGEYSRLEICSRLSRIMGRSYQ